jgi:Papain family cysteine protease
VGVEPRPVPLPFHRGIYALNQMAAPERVDLRVGACYPYAAVGNQGEAQSCVAHSFSVALYCLKAHANLRRFPVSLLHDAPLERIFSEALHVSPDRSRGTSFEAVIRSAMRSHGSDLESLGWRVVALKNSVAQCKRRLRLGAPIVAGYQVNQAVAKFHSDARTCEAHGFLLPPFSASPQAESGHAVLILGFDDSIGCFIARNSWGEAWGVGGHFLVRYRDVEDATFFTDLVSFALLSEATSPSVEHRS